MLAGQQQQGHHSDRPSPLGGQPERSIRRRGLRREGLHQHGGPAATAQLLGEVAVEGRDHPPLAAVHHQHQGTVLQTPLQPLRHGGIEGTRAQGPQRPLPLRQPRQQVQSLRGEGTGEILRQPLKCGHQEGQRPGREPQRHPLQGRAAPGQGARIQSATEQQRRILPLPLTPQQRQQRQKLLQIPVAGAGLNRQAAGLQHHPAKALGHPWILERRQHLQPLPSLPGRALDLMLQQRLQPGLHHGGRGHQSRQLLARRHQPRTGVRRRPTGQEAFHLRTLELRPQGRQQLRLRLQRAGTQALEPRLQWQPAPAQGLQLSPVLGIPLHGPACCGRLHPDRQPHRHLS